MSKLSNTTSQGLKELATTIGLDYTETLSNYPYIREKNALLPFSFVKKHHIIALGFENGFILLALSDPYNLDALKEAKFLLRCPIKEVLAQKSTITREIENLYIANNEHRSLDEEFEEADSYREGDNKDKEYDLLEHSSSSSVVSLLNSILLEAIREGASDIHFEPGEKQLLVKFRVDGILFEKHSLAKGIENQIITRLKVQAELDIAESRMPQDGRIKLKMGDQEIDFRLSTVPVIFGERLVLRISDNSRVLGGLDNLELKKDFLASFRKDIGRKQGIILVTGPTGSGKTRTLYSALSEINHGELNIMTIEDPVENKLENMAQINVNQKRGLNFAKGLKHILRQDPDVIMIGEIRDKETVDIAIEASLTGHLVLSTLHTNDAPSTIVRLIDMGVEPYLISSSLIAVCSQRLVRKICVDCKGHEEKKKSCSTCGYTGYKGRRAIYEYLKVTPKIKEAISSSTDIMTLTRLAKEEGMTTLFEDGLSYVNEGITTLEEIGRVTSDTGGE